MSTRRIVVIGAGLGGLSAACHLTNRTDATRRGEIVVLERAAVPGGRAGLIETGGYRFDPGPCVLTMTGILADTFRAAGASMDDHVTIRPVDPMYRAVFDARDGGGELRVRHGRDAMTEEIRSFAGATEAAAFARFADRLTALYDVEMPSYIDRNFDGVRDLVRPLRPALALARLGGFSTLHRIVSHHFRDPRLQKIFSFQAMYAGLSPLDALGAYAVITYMDTIAGVYFPEGGMHAIARGLAAAAEKAGVHIRYGVDVERVVRAPGSTGKVLGVRVSDGETIEADVVVVNADLPVAYDTLLRDVARPRSVRDATYSPSCALWLAGVRGQMPAGSEHHNIHFGHDWGASFKALLHDGSRMAEPSMLVTVPTAGDASLSPEGRSILYVLEPMPHLGGRIDWSREREAIRRSMQARVAALGYPAADVHVDVEHFFDPNDWQRQGMAMGTPFSLAHTFFQTGPFRPRNTHPNVPGLVFVGSATVPGVGVPMVLLSGRLAAERVAQQEARA